jgi:hypothetical protein
LLKATYPHTPVRVKTHLRDAGGKPAGLYSLSILCSAAEAYIQAQFPH